MIDSELLDLLICPACGEGSDITPNSDCTALICSLCGRQYPVREGIPVMLIDEALPANTPIGPTTSSPTSQRETGDEPRHE